MKSIHAGPCWVRKLFEHVQNFRTDLPKLHGREEHCSNWLSLSLSLLEWPGMTRNDHPNKLELSIRLHSGVDSAQWDWGINSNSSSSLITASKISLPHDITQNTHCHVTMGRWGCLGNHIMSQWVGDIVIDTKQSCDERLGSCTQNPEKPGSFTQDPHARKTWIFHLKNSI